MKTILHLIGIVGIVLFSLVGNAQISGYEICDDNNDGFTTFDLTVKISEILDGNNPNDYVITFHETYDAAESNIDEIIDPYINMIPYVQTMYVRIENLNDSTFEIDSFDLIVHSSPEIGQPVNLFNSNGIFDLTGNASAIYNGNTDLSVTFHLTYDDAETGATAIVDETSYNAASSHTIYVRAESISTSCFAITSFHLILSDTDDIVYIPDTNFKTKLLQADTSNNTAKDINDNSIKIDINNDGEIQVSEALSVYALSVSQPMAGLPTAIDDLTGIESFINLTVFTCRSNNLTVLDVSNLINLKRLYCEYNNLTELDVSNNPNLNDLNCNSNLLTELDVSNNPNLIYLACGINLLTELDFSNNINLAVLACHQNNLTELDLSNNINLGHLIFNENNLTELDVSNNINLTYLVCHQNNLTELDLSNNIHLTQLLCFQNNLTELDLSNHPALKILVAGLNSQLSYINIKNGGILDFDWINTWNGLPDNIYICADEEEVDFILPYLNQSGTTGQIISTYCSFFPVGDYNTITGTVTYDFNNNGCDNNDNLTILSKVTINDGTEEGSSFTNQDGEYVFFTQDGTFTITPDIENPSFFNITPVTETVIFIDNNNNVEVVNFCITPNGVNPDVEVVLVPLVPARPGFNAKYKIVYRNKGNQEVSGSIDFDFDDTRLDFVSSNPTVNNQSVGLLTYNFTNLLPFESREILLTLNVNGPTEIPSVNIDDILPFMAEIIIDQTDVITDDNTYEFNQVVVGSFDPNDITCIEGDVVHPNNIGEELHYVIRFENTGNYYAENVVVAMEIDTTKYDVDSVRLLNTSHNANAQIKNDVLEVFFNQIMLDSGGHGNILLVMKSVSSLSEGDSVQSKADIYFDYNYPIITNDAVTLFQATMSIEDNPKVIDLKFYPNPTTDYFNITSQEIIQSVELYDTSGRLIRTSLVNDFESKQNVSNLTNGIYILKIKTNKGEVTGKIVKQ